MEAYYSFFSTYINIVGIIWGGIKIGFFAGAISLMLLIIFRKFVLVPRRYRILSYLAGSYYFFIPIICLCFGFGYGSLATAKEQVIDKLPIYQNLLHSFITENFDTDVTIVISSDKSLEQSIDAAYYEIIQRLNDETKLGTQQQLIPRFILALYQSPIGINYIKSNMKNKISVVTGLERDLVDEIFQIKLSTLLTGSTLIHVLNFYIIHIVNSLLIPIMILWGILLGIPILEIIGAYYLNRKNKDSLLCK